MQRWNRQSLRVARSIERNGITSLSSHRFPVIAKIIPVPERMDMGGVREQLHFEDFHRGGFVCWSRMTGVVLRRILRLVDFCTSMYIYRLPINNPTMPLTQISNYRPNVSSLRNRKTETDKAKKEKFRVAKNPDSFPVTVSNS